MILIISYFRKKTVGDISSPTAKILPTKPTNVSDSRRRPPVCLIIALNGKLEKYLRLIPLVYRRLTRAFVRRRRNNKRPRLTERRELPRRQTLFVQRSDFWYIYGRGGKYAKRRRNVISKYRRITTYIRRLHERV